ncbi:MAG: DUF3024 domain-containing protein [Vibrio sp.]
MITDLDWHRAIKKAEELCHYRNGSVPVDQGKACFESDEESKCLIIMNEIFSVDSLHHNGVIDVAKICYDSNHELWELYINAAVDNPLAETEWLPHPVHFAHQNPLVLFTAIEQDEEGCIWR